MRFLSSTCLIAGLAVAMAGNCFAITIASNSEAFPTSYGYNATEVFYIGLAVTSDYHNVDVAVETFRNQANPYSADAYETTVIGPSENPATDQLAFANFTPPAFSAGYVTIFSGLSLSAGKTYYFVLGDQANGDGSVSAAHTSSGTHVQDPGISAVTFGQSYGSSVVVNNAPQSQWSGLSCCSDGLIFSVTGDAGPATPEPRTTALMGTLLAGFVAQRRWRSR